MRYVMDAKGFWDAADRLTGVILAGFRPLPDPRTDWEAWNEWVEEANRDVDAKIEVVFEVPAALFIRGDADAVEVNGGEHVVVTLKGVVVTLKGA